MFDKIEVLSIKERAEFKMGEPILDPDLKKKISVTDFTFHDGEWKTNIGHHRLVEMIIAYYSGNKYSLSSYIGSDYQIKSIFNYYNHIRKRTDQLPSNLPNIQFFWNSDYYWLAEPGEDTYMLTIK